MKHAEKLKSQFTYNRKQVLFLTGISEQEYQNLQIDTARAWIERYCYGLSIDALLNCTLFWKWWNYMWNEADDDAILSQVYEAESKYYTYRMLHQYVFDNASVRQQQLLGDFKAMRYDFELEMKSKAGR